MDRTPPTPPAYIRDKPDKTPIEKLKERVAALESSVVELDTLRATTTDLCAFKNSSATEIDYLKNENVKLTSDLIETKEELRLMGCWVEDLKAQFESFRESLCPKPPSQSKTNMSLPAVDVRTVAIPFGEKPFDNAGLIYFIGTNEYTTRFSNPHASGKVVASFSTVCPPCLPSVFVNHQEEEFGSTNNEMMSWMMVDIGRHRSMVVKEYSLRHGWNKEYYVLRNWELQGSNDGENWDVLRKHMNDSKLDSASYSTSYWPVPDAPNGYRYFRILLTGDTSNQSNHLRCSGIEFYGTLTIKDM